MLSSWQLLCVVDFILFISWKLSFDFCHILRWWWRPHNSPD